MRVALKISALAVILGPFLCAGIVCDILPLRAWARRRAKAWCAHVTARALLPVLGIQLRGRAELAERLALSPCLLLCNHLSYLDVVLLAAVHPSAFVTSREVQQSGLQGWLARAGGAVFVERRRRTQVAEQIGQVAEALRDGLPLVLFPEGTSGDGRAVLPFRSSLLQAALDSIVNIQPVCLNYLRADGIELGRSSAEKIFYFGDHEFVPHLLSLLALRSIEIQLDLLPTIAVTPQADRRVLADQARQFIAGAFQTVL